MTGSTSSGDFPITTGAFQSAFGGNGDAFVTKLNALTAAVASISARSLSFGNQALGLPSAAHTVTITNSGDAALLVSSIVESGDIYQPPGTPLPPPIDLHDWNITTDNCTGISVAPGSSCTFTVTFSPNPLAAPAGLGVGARTGTLTISDNATSPTQVIQLTGTGVSPPAANLSVASLAFPNEPVGKASPSQTATLSSTGGFALAISSIQISGDFAGTNTCSNSLGPGATCTFTITFTPTTAGARTGTLSINDNASGSPQTVALSGTGTAPVAGLTPTTLDFGGEAVGSISAAQTVTLNNSGNQSLALTGITITGPNSGDFAQTNTCAVSISAGSSCAINVTFTPGGAGTRTANRTFADNGPDSPQTVGLAGIGADFVMAVSSPAVMVLAGSPATFTVTVTPQNGFNGKVAFSCSGLPAFSSCSASPPSVTGDGTTPVTATVTVTTKVRSITPPRAGPRLTNWPRAGRAPWFVGLMLLLAGVAVAARRRRPWVSITASLLLALGLMACGEGPGGVVDPSGTSSGSYTITITGASGPVTHTVTAALQVQQKEGRAAAGSFGGQRTGFDLSRLERGKGSPWSRFSGRLCW